MSSTDSYTASELAEAVAAVLCRPGDGACNHCQIIREAIERSGGPGDAQDAARWRYLRKKRVYDLLDEEELDAEMKRSAATPESR